MSTDAGQPPSTLADPAVLELYDVIVVGAPRALTSADVAGLETFLRRRGGAVVLLYDENPGSSAVDRLIGTSRWTPATLRAPVAARGSADSTALRVTEAAWASSLPPAADPRVVARINGTERALVWTTPAGAGQVIVSGALDAWKFRDRATSGFDEFWRATISRAARESQDAVTVTVSPNVAEPGQRLTVTVTSRDAGATPDVRLDSTPVTVWRDEPGTFTARITAPAVGDHWLRVSAGGARAEAPLAIREAVERARPDEWATIEMITRASGGVAGSVDAVHEAIRSSVTPERRMERWWPMRNGWWIVPFVGLLGLEWLARRRKGLA